jgi:2-polyprenyl-3-methyl-5-hydroxy-6-metoxy-1,4-benzoquinol methylase
MTTAAEKPAGLGPTAFAAANSSHECPICGVKCKAQISVYDDRYGYPGVYELYACAQCGHRSLNAGMTPEAIAALYTNYYPRSTFDATTWGPPGESAPWRIWFLGLKASAFRWVPRNVRVLDIGCGFGESLGYHRDRGCDVYGVEADENILRVARLHGLNVRVGLFNASNYEPESFDVVTLDQVIEHVSDPLTVLAGVHQVLKTDGLLILSTPNAAGWGARIFGRRWIHWHAPYHQQFFSARSISTAANRAGFVVERRRTVTNSAWLGYQWAHLVTFPSPGTPSSFWSSKTARTPTERILLAMLAGISRLGVNSVLTRVFDSLGIGDNVVYVLRRQAQ